MRADRNNRHLGRIFCVRDWSRVACRRFSAAATERKARPSGALPEGHAQICAFFLFFKDNARSKQLSILAVFKYLNLKGSKKLHQMVKWNEQSAVGG